MELMEALRNEYKEYSQLWVEINYTASTYDEINMCKSRLRAVDPEEIEDKEEKSRLDISKYEVDDHVQEFTQQLQAAEMGFVRKQGRLKYLKHLEKNKEVENCPICTQAPETKYAVLECGHHLCMVCCIRMTKIQPTHLKCFICRHQQLVKK